MSSVIEHHAIELRLSGRVQGVGFRPFVFQLAQAHHISGWICNTIGLVEIHAEGSAENLECFVAQLVEHAPPLSRPVIDRQWKAPLTGSSDFSIIASKNAGPAQIHIPPDSYLCCLCEQELYSEIDRRYHYPFINCTQCGPRYTIISGMPYDRANTSMEKFDLCDSCLQEYEDPGNRRFHAEPNACAECGPHLSFAGLAETVHGNSQLAIAATLSALQKGDIIAVKGVGGYHLVCDAANPRSIERLRRKKNRPHKPLALMVPAVGADLLDGVRALVDLENDEIAGALKSPERPVVLLKSKAGSSVAEAVAPGLDELGIMLPPSPLHLLLARQFGSALVVTSGNISGEPVITDDAEAATRLASVADGFLSHNRNIVRPADDSVIRPLAGSPR